METKWWITVACFAVGHFLTVVGVLSYCLDQYYRKACPLDTLGMILVSPVCFLPLEPHHPLIMPLFLSNSCLWGCVLAEPFRWWFGWKPWRFSLRTLLIATTIIAVVLGMVAVAGR